MRYLLSLIALLLLSACHPATSPEPPRQETVTASEWNLQLDVSGGIAGLQRRLLLDHNGQLTALDLKSKRHVSRPLTPSEHEEIESLLQALPQTPASDTGNRALPLSTRCADCIESRLQLTLDGTAHRHTRRAPTAATSPYDALNNYLTGLLQQALNPQNNL